MRLFYLVLTCLGLLLSSSGQASIRSRSWLGPVPPTGQLVSVVGLTPGQSVPAGRRARFFTVCNVQESAPKVFIDIHNPASAAGLDVTTPYADNWVRGGMCMDFVDDDGDPTTHTIGLRTASTTAPEVEVHSSWK